MPFALPAPPHWRRSPMARSSLPASSAWCCSIRRRISARRSASPSSSPVVFAWLICNVATAPGWRLGPEAKPLVGTMARPFRWLCDSIFGLGRAGCSSGPARRECASVRRRRRENRQPWEYNMKDHDAYALAVNNATHHAIFLLDEEGVILSWNIGAQNIFGYSADEIIGCSSSITFVEEDRAKHQSAVEMETASSLGYAADDRWHLRKDGTRFWASGIMTPAYDEAGDQRGFLKIIRDKTTEKLASERSLYLARHDSLTGLA